MKYPNKGLSIDIGNDQIKVIQYKKSKNKVKIIKAILLDTPNGCVEDGAVADFESLATVLSEAIKEHGIKEKKAIFTVASSKIITREVDLPDLPKKKLDSLIQMNAEEYFPVELADYIVDYRILEHYVEGEDKMVRVNIVAAHEPVMNTYIQLADAIGIKINGIDYSGNSIINYSEHMAKEGTYLLLDLGSRSTMVTIVSNGHVRFNRILVYGTSIVISSIQNHFNVRYKEAVKISGEQMLLKDKPAADDVLASDVSNAMNQILSGIARLVDFYTSRNKDGIEEIYLVGGGTNIEGIADYISEYFNVQTSVISELSTISSEQDATYQENGVYFANAIGATFTEMNLLPESYKNKDQQRAANRLRLEVGVLLLALVLGAMYVPFANVRRLEKEKEALEQEIEEMKVVETVKAEYDQAMREVQFYLDIETASSSTTQIILQVIEAMESSIPEGVDYMTINNTEEGMVISSTADDKLVLVNFIRILKTLTLDEQPVFQNVYMPSYTNPDATDNPVVSDDGYYQFTIVCTYAEGVAIQ